MQEKYIEIIIPTGDNIARKMNEYEDYDLAALITMPGFVKIIMAKKSKKVTK